MSRWLKFGEIQKTEKRLILTLCFMLGVKNIASRCSTAPEALTLRQWLMEHVAYSQEVGALLIACDLSVADLRDDGNVCCFGFRHESELLSVIEIEM